MLYENLPGGSPSKSFIKKKNALFNRLPVGLLSPFKVILPVDKGCSLPSDNQNIETPSAIALLGYIRNHFKNTCTTKLYILSALNGFENKPISKTVTRKLSDLSYKDLYYQEMKLLKIIR